MSYIAPHIVEKAKEIDLLTYLHNYESNELVSLGGGVYSTREHDSLKISNGKWYWWSRGIGGRSALDYLIKVKGHSFMEAVNLITERTSKGSPIFLPQKQKQTSKKMLILPKRSASNGVVKVYLLGRGINEQIINACIRQGSIYESLPYHNAVFIGFDKDGKPRQASFRAANRSRIMGECEGSDKRFSFRLVDESSDCLHVFESAIDLLSFATLAKMDGRNYEETNLISLAGIYSGKADGEYKVPEALNHFLEVSGKIRYVCLHLDKDRPGRVATAGIEKMLKDKVITFDVPPPIGKDYNECLMLKLKSLEKNRKREGHYER